MFSEKWYNKRINKIFWSKHKRVLSIAFAAVFLAALFLYKNGYLWKEKELSDSLVREGGLLYESTLIQDVVRKDTDGDGVLDWEEGLWGLDPFSSETTPGTPDIVTVNKLRAGGEGSAYAGEGGGSVPEEKLTETDKFSRELFSTVASLNQSGALDAATLESITQELANRLQNSEPRKVYALADLRITSDNSASSIKKYNDTLESIYAKYPVAGKTMDIMQKFIVDEETVDESALEELDPLVARMETIISLVLEVSVPQSLALLHLDTLNALQRITENLNDMRMFATDPLLALSGVGQYEKNVALLGTTSDRLKRAIAQKLGN